MNPVAQSQDFSNTRWSMVHRLQGAHSAEARNALSELAVRYWYPVYAYVRRCGHTQEIAQDIAQVFLHQVGDELGKSGVAPPGRFRNWLLDRLNAFLAGEWRELAEADDIGEAPSLPELEARNRREHAPDESAEHAYQRGFALEVLARGLTRLRAEATQTGHLDMCEALEPFLVRDPLPGQYEETGHTLGVRPLALVVALKRLRQRYRELVRQELADIVSSPEEMAAEQEALFAALERRR